MTPPYRTHHERVDARFAEIKDKTELADTAWLILQAGPLDVEERRQAKKAIRSAQNLTRQVMADPNIRAGRKQEVAATHERLTHMVETIKHRPKNKAA